MNFPRYMNLSFSAAYFYRAVVESCYTGWNFLVPWNLFKRKNAQDCIAATPAMCEERMNRVDSSQVQ